ncbi:RNA-binding domain-containing protein [Dyella sp.]|uniref:RNA-binding domain-containing protein n=1 Tax=Dyella sp. TaxID=1869338 RepID=UPI003F7F4BEB
MQLIDLLSLFRKVKLHASESLESEILEFKEYRDTAALNNSKELSDEVVAFANAKGGTIIVGIRDSSNVKGGDWASQLVGFPSCDVIEVRDRLLGRINPRIGIKVEQYVYEDKNYLLIGVPDNRGGLVATTSGKIHIRDGRSSRPMTPAEVECAVKALPNYDWSSEELSLDTIGSLDLAAVERGRMRFSEIRKIKDLTVPNFLEAVGATKGGILTKGGLLLFGRSELIESEIGLFEFRFSWKTKSGDLLLNDVWSGCLWEAIERANRHFESCNSFKQFTWKEVKHLVPMLDFVAFHEGFLNALVHRDYAQDGMVSVDYQGSKMSITSPGSFYGGVTAENIFKHQPRHRNKALARILMAFNFVDRAGMGVRRMSLRSLVYGRKFPKFRELGGVIEVIMDAEYMRGAIFVIAHETSAEYGVAELIVLNSVYGVSAVPVAEVIDQLAVLSDDPWDELCRVVNDLRFVEFCASRDGVVVRVKNKYAAMFEVSKQIRPSRVSDKLIALYLYLKKHQFASNADLCGVLSYSHSSQTSAFLRRTKFVKREGDGPASVWKLVEGC